MTKRVLVIAPHADDEILGCGGTIGKHIAQGDTVWIIIATNASFGAPELFPPEQVEMVRKEALNAHQLLGVERTIFLEFPAPALNAFPSYKISLSLDTTFKEYQPNVLYLPYPGDLHEDHRSIYRSALVSARPVSQSSVKEIYCYETLSETDWAPIASKEGFIPNCFVDITDFLERKLDAMQQFGSQLRAFPNPRSLEGLTALSKLRGSTIGVHHAEAFVLERFIR